MNAGNKIISPMATGNGAHVLHKGIEARLAGYRVVDYSPWLTLFPPLLPGVIRNMRCALTHTTPDYGLFFRRPRTPLILTIHNYVCDLWMRLLSPVQSGPTLTRIRTLSENHSPKLPRGNQAYGTAIAKGHQRR